MKILPGQLKLLQLELHRQSKKSRGRELLLLLGKRGEEIATVVLAD